MHILMMIVGVTAGIIIGTLPGLNVVFAIAVLLPFTFGMDSISSIYMLLGTYCGGTFGGSISAILINTPGTPASCATMFEGYPMSQNGKAGDALKIALISSFLGGIISCVALIFFAPQIANLATKFGAPEFFALCIFGMSAAIGIAGDKIVKGIIMAALGLLFSTVGIDSTEGVQRFIFGNMYLLSGISPVAIMLGIFALTEVIIKSVNITRNDNSSALNVVYTKASVKVVDILKHWKTIIRSSFLGVIIGAVPGTGGGIASMLSYNEARRNSKHPEEFGKGSIEGLIAPEAGNNATTGATLIPLLTLGIPGDASVAVLIGALTMQGIVPGPSLFKEGSIWVFVIIGGLFLINIIMLIQGLSFIRIFANIIKVPVKILTPSIMILCMVGAFSITLNSYNIIIMIFFGILGYILRTNDFPFAPLIIALVLGNLMESNLRRSLMLSQGDPSIFFTKPISLLIITLALLSLLYPLLRKLVVKIKNK
jgi:putative tricarboxylic transport membrane protein